MENISTWMEQSMLETGRRTSNMDRALRRGRMEPTMTETIIKEENKVRADSYGLMAVLSSATF